MIKEFLESLKLKDIVFFVLIIVLFCMVLKKNKKEGFAYSSPTDVQKDIFKVDVQEALGDNFQAIKNLGDFTDALQSGNDYTFPANLTITGNLNVNGTTALKGPSTVKGKDLTNFDSRITAAQNKATSAKNTADAAVPKNGNTTITGDLKINGELNVKEMKGIWYMKSSGGNVYAHISGGAVSGYTMTAHHCPKDKNHSNCQWGFIRSVDRDPF